MRSYRSGAKEELTKKFQEQTKLKEWREIIGLNLGQFKQQSIGSKRSRIFKSKIS